MKYFFYAKGSKFLEHTAFSGGENRHDIDVYEAFRQTQEQAENGVKNISILLVYVHKCFAQFASVGKRLTILKKLILLNKSTCNYSMNKTRIMAEGISLIWR